MRRFLPAAVLVLSLAACDATQTFEIGGVYSGVTETTIDVTTLEITVPDTESGATFSFTGMLFEGTNGEIETPIAGSGTYDHPDVTLTVQGEAIAGVASDDGDALTFTDADGSFTLRRQGQD